MTDSQLARRMGVGVSRISAIEKGEITGGTTLRTLRQAAGAMNCSFVYAFVPIEPLDDILRERALTKAQTNISRLDHTMRLENQAVLTPDLHAAKQRAVDLLAGQLGEPHSTWGRTSLGDAGEIRARYVEALRAADERDIGPLLLFGRS